MEAVFGNKVYHERFLAAYRLTEETHPFLALDLNDWETPFRPGGEQRQECVQSGKCMDG